MLPIGPKIGPKVRRDPPIRPRQPRETALSRDSGVELAGLEPPTSWVRSRRSPALSLACLQGFYALEARSEARLFGQFPLISAEIGGDAASYGLPLSRELYDDVSRLHTLRNGIVHRGERVEENGLSGSC